MKSSKEASANLIRFFVQNHGGVVVLFGLVTVPPTPNLVAAIPGSYDAFFDHFGRHGFQIVSPTDFREQIDHLQGEINATELCCFIVPREGVMVVMPSFANREERDKTVFSWVDVPVIIKVKLSHQLFLLVDTYLSYGLEPHI